MGAGAGETFEVRLDRSGREPLADQLHAAIAAAIASGALASGARLPSWSALASRAGVSRGTVRKAYGRLASEALVEGLGAAGTRVLEGTARPLASPGAAKRPPSMINEVGRRPMPFQLGVPAQDAFPAKTWSRALVRAARRAALAPVGYPDPRGHPDLRAAVAAHVAVARGLVCAPEQVVVTAGFSGALGLLVAALGLSGAQAWTEDPGFPRTRTALAYAGVATVAVPVDGEGLRVAAGHALAPSAKAAIVTPGQQAPLGMRLSDHRRAELLSWADSNGAWIVEDDYLSELHLERRPPPCLAAEAAGGRVIHVGSFSKTLTPAIRLGYIVAPPELAERLGDVAACLAPTPGLTEQIALAELLERGWLLAHMRRMRRIYAERSRMLRARLSLLRPLDPPMAAMALSVRLTLPDAIDDVALARRAMAEGLAPVPLSAWYARHPAPRALLLGVTNVEPASLDEDCEKLVRLLNMADRTRGFQRR